MIKEDIILSEFSLQDFRRQNHRAEPDGYDLRRRWDVVFERQVYRNKPLEQLSEEAALHEPNYRLRLAAIFLADAIHERNIYHRINDFSVKIYRIFFHPAVRMITLLHILLLVLLGFFEPPFTNVPLPLGATLSIELYIMLVMLVRVVAWFQLYEWRKLRGNGWKFAKLFIVILTMVDCLITYFLPSNIRITRVLRPFFLVEHLTVLRIRTLLLVRTLRRMPEYLLLMAFVIIIYTAIAYTLFRVNTADPHFTDLFETAFNLLVLQTTANYPDVTVFAFDLSPWYSLFFISYLIIQLYVLFNLTLATVYREYKKESDSKDLRNFLRQRVALLACFRVLDYHRTGAVDYDTFKTMLLTYRPRTTDEQARAIFRVLDANRSGQLELAQFFTLCEILIGNIAIKESDQLSAKAKISFSARLPHAQSTIALPRTPNDSATDLTVLEGPLTPTTPVATTNFIEPTLTPKPSEDVLPAAPEPAPAEQDTRTSASTGTSSHHEASASAETDSHIVKVEEVKYPTVGVKATRDRPKRSWWSRIPSLQTIVYHRAFIVCIIALSIANLMAIYVELSIDDTDYLWKLVLEGVFTSLFTIYILLRLVAVGFKRFFKDRWNIYGFVTIMASVVTYIIDTYLLVTYGTPRKAYIVFAVLRVFRILKFVHYFPQMKRLNSLLQTLWNAAPAIGVQFMIIGAFFYSYSIIGQWIFGTALTRDNPALKGTAYDANNFYDVANFKTLWNGFLTMFHLMIVNNWHATMRAGIVAVGSRWAVIYFIIFWIAALILLANLLIAAIIDSYTKEAEALDKDLEKQLAKREEKKAARLRAKRATQSGTSTPTQSSYSYSRPPEPKHKAKRKKKVTIFIPPSKQAGARGFMTTPGAAIVDRELEDRGYHSNVHTDDHTDSGFPVLPRSNSNLSDLIAEYDITDSSATPATRNYNQSPYSSRMSAQMQLPFIITVPISEPLPVASVAHPILPPSESDDNNINNSSSSSSNSNNNNKNDNDSNNGQGSSETMTPNVPMNSPEVEALQPTVSMPELVLVAGDNTNDVHTDVQSEKHHEEQEPPSFV